MKRDSIAMCIGVFAAVLAQIVIAPNIALFSNMPNFLLVFALVAALVRPANGSTLVLAFFFGLLYDLLGHGPVGAMAFLMVLIAFLVSRLFTLLDNDTFFMPIIILVIAVFVVEILYAVFMIIFGVAAGPLEAFVYQAIPSALYDCVAGLIFYPLALRFFVSAPLSAGSNVSATPSASMKVSSSGRRRVRRSQKKIPRF